MIASTPRQWTTAAYSCAIGLSYSSPFTDHFISLHRWRQVTKVSDQLCMTTFMTYTSVCPTSTRSWSVETNVDQITDYQYNVLMQSSSLSATVRGTHAAWPRCVLRAYSGHNWSVKLTRKPSNRWQTRATRKPAKNCSNSTCLQRCRWQY